MTLFDKIMARFGQMSIPARANEPMSAHTTFRIGGPARVFCTPNSQVQLAQAIMACRELGLRYYLLGRGSNVLFADEGYEGVVIQIGSKLGDIQVDGRRVTAGAGALLAHVCLAAAEAGLAPKYLCRVFRQVTGRTPIDYLNYYRIECAAELLCTTTDSITDVALSCGFNDPSYFSRMFRRQKRVSAHVYRNQYSEGG